MLFDDQDLKLIINRLAFKAYLEESDITYETKDQQLPFAPISFRNDSMAIRVTEKAKFTFNVFSETRYECVNNYRHLQKLLVTIRPSYEYINDQLVPLSSNVTGFINIKFKGLHDLGLYGKNNINNRDNVTLHLNSFSYSINKDLGYIHVPKKEILNPNEPRLFSEDGMKLIPVGYKISLEGKVLLPFESTANVNGSLSKFGKPLTPEEYQKYLTEKSYRKSLLTNLKSNKNFLFELQKKAEASEHTLEQQKSLTGEEFEFGVQELAELREEIDKIKESIRNDVNVLNLNFPNNPVNIEDYNTPFDDTGPTGVPLE